MPTCYIHRIRSDHRVVLQPALTTSTPGIYLAHRVDKPMTRPAWQLRLKCGIALGDGCYDLTTCRRLAALLGTVGIEWTADEAGLAAQVAVAPQLDQRIRDLLAAATACTAVTLGGAA